MVTIGILIWFWVAYVIWYAYKNKTVDGWTLFNAFSMGILTHSLIDKII